eukprot:257883-Pleurochrysis_carterae.AAC.1
MNLGKGERNVVIKAFNISKKAGGNGDRAQRGIAGVHQDDDKSKPIIRGPEIQQEVHKIATKINKAEEVDIQTVKEVLEWMGIGGDTGRRTDRIKEVDRICTRERGKVALGKLQSHKGLGKDGFDGYLIRNATQELQDTYHEVIKDILKQEDYPAEWNE